MLKILFGHAHDHRRIHLHEAAICVISESLIPGCRSEACDRAVVQAEIENRLHHSGHGASRAGTHANKEWILRVAKLLLCGALERHHVIGHLFLQLGRILLSVLVKIVAGFRGDGETSWHRQADLGHLGETRALTTEEISPGSIPFCLAGTEKIRPFFHCTPRLSFFELWNAFLVPPFRSGVRKNCRHADFALVQVILEIASAALHRQVQRSRPRS